MHLPRMSGMLLHPTSLPGPFGVGDLGPATAALLDFLAASRQKLWQVLPLGPTGFGNSPYAALSAFAGNPLLISPDRLVDDRLIAASALASPPRFLPERIDYGTVIPWKTHLLRQAFERFQAQPLAPLVVEYEAFCDRQRDWLDDWAIFAALKEAHGGRAWIEWESALARREARALETAKTQYAAEIAFHRFAQFLFARQWQAVREAARERSIAILGDLPIFVAHDSADVWSHPELFRLDARGSPTVVAGVPPDYFSDTGQRWGNPHYRWEVLRETGYAWWIARTRRALELADYIRLDHFRGFEAAWEIPADHETAAGGRWVPGPGDDLFRALGRALGATPFIAEDLGVITPAVDALRQRLGFPTMRVLQFAFSSDAQNQHLPHNFQPDTVVYTGTHDNDTTRGWFEACSARERSHALRYMDSDAERVVGEMIRLALASVAALAIVPMQDVLGLGSEARMNFPSRPQGNWEWRCREEHLRPRMGNQLASFASLYGR